ncbi:retrotransposon protein, putative, ty1-copia subclass [Tanacetum coccineum]|uniref:Retrotransposon protein, putative, ty1-copia subclass n=1 Tax=Tanacetum coccineum TaxID=301880 RepID=A0ABQ5G8V3_9ASTR
MNGLTSNFAGFVKNYNMHNMRKTIGELHALLIEYEKDLPKKAATPQVMAIQGGRIQKANKKSLNAKGKGEGKGKGKDKSVIPKPKNPKNMVKDDACHHCKEVGHCKRNCPAYLAELIKKKKQVGTANSSGKMIRKPFPHRAERATDLLGQIHIDVCGLLRHVSRQEVSGRAVELEKIQDEDTSPFENTSKIPIEVEGFEPPQEEVVPVRRVDYEETFSPVADIRAIRILIAITAFYDYEILQMDVKTAFLNGYHDEDICMVQPDGFVYPNHPRKVCKLQRSIYGLKMDTSKRGYIPMQERLDLNKTQGASTPEEVKRMQNIPYASVVGSIMYATGYVFILNGGTVDWKSSKQSTTAMSATEAEYIATSEAAMEAVWIRKFISGLGIIPTINEPIKMFCDNSAALLIVNEPGVQRDTRHYH